MTLIRMTENPTLAGHKLLVLTQWAPPNSWLKDLQAKYSGLKVVYHHLEWSEKQPGKDFPHDEWKDVTILLTGNAIPSRETAPKLQYIQLTSAGANQILKNPLFLETDVAFCTANGVHG